MVQHTASGPFSSREIAPGLWQLKSATADIFLRPSSDDAAAVLRHADFTTLDVDWRPKSVVVRHAGAKGAGYFDATTVLVHEPSSRFYRDLPLAPFDAKAQRFWRRIFMLMRIPGGRSMLAYIARRNR